MTTTLLPTFTDYGIDTTGTAQQTRMYGVELSGLGLPQITSITLNDSNSGVGGSAGIYSGFDLDAIFLDVDGDLSTTDDRTYGSEFYFLAGDTRPGNYAPPSTSGGPTSGSTSLFGIDEEFATLNDIDAVFFGTGNLTLGDGGTITVLFEPRVTIGTSLYLFVGEVSGDAGENLDGLVEITDEITIGVLETGDSDDDALSGTELADTLSGQDGNDTLSGLGENDVLLGGAGEDFIRGNDGDDYLSGGEGNDRIFAGPDDQGDDTIYGDGGNDVVGGGAGNDDLHGDVGSDTVFGGAGDDVLDESGTDDSHNALWGGTGTDTITGGDGNDALGGGDGADQIDGGGGNDRLYGGQTTHGDTLSGGSGNDTIYAGAGDDSVDGGDGDDVIYNGPGSDTVNGGDGDDMIWAGPGDDLLAGDAGADVFSFAGSSGADTITDFEAGIDIIEVQQSETSVDVDAIGSDVRITISDSGSVLVLNASVSDVEDALIFIF